jgi:hypothetical protein
MGENYREIELFIGPLREFETKDGNKASSIHIVSNGNVDTLKVHVSCSKPVISVGSTCNISIWNLKMETINALRTAGATVRVYVGYEGQEKNLLFTGSIRSVVTDRQGPDFVTKITCLAMGANMVRSVTSKSYAAGVDLKSAVIELAKQIPGITPDPANVNLKGTIGYCGWSFVGSTKDALDKLAYQFGFSWHVENGTFYAVQDGTAASQAILLNSANGLRKVSPRLTGLLQIQEGTDIQAQFVPNVGPGKKVRVVSELNPHLSKEYYCWEVSYDLCPKDDSWDMNITSYIIAGSWGG